MKSFSSLIILLMFFGSACGQKKVESKRFNVLLKTMLSHSVAETTVADLDIENNEIVYLDARAIEEYEVSRIPGAHWVGYDSFELNRVKNIAKDAPVVVYCSIGYRSEKVAEKLLNAGFSNVSNLYGGIFEYSNSEKPLVDSAGLMTNKVHAYSKSWGIWLKKGEKVY